MKTSTDRILRRPPPRRRFDPREPLGADPAAFRLSYRANRPTPGLPKPRNAYPVGPNERPKVGNSPAYRRAQKLENAVVPELPKPTNRSHPSLQSLPFRSLSHYYLDSDVTKKRNTKEISLTVANFKVTA